MSDDAVDLARVEEIRARHEDFVDRYSPGPDWQPCSQMSDDRGWLLATVTRLAEAVEATEERVLNEAWAGARQADAERMEALEWIHRSIRHDARRLGDGDEYATIEEHNAEVEWLTTTADRLLRRNSFAGSLPPSESSTDEARAAHTRYVLADAGWKETIRQLEAAQQESARLRAALEREARVWDWLVSQMMDPHSSAYVDWDAFEDFAVKAGLIVETRYDPEQHGPDFEAVEPGDPFWILTPAGQRLANAAVPRPTPPGEAR